MPESAASRTPSGEHYLQISSKTVGAALRSIAQGTSPNKDISALYDLFLVQRLLRDGTAPVSDEARWVALSEVLIKLIKRHLAACRTQMGLAALDYIEDRASAEADLAAIGAMHREVLGQWAMLYYRFVRVDFEFRIGELVSAFGLPKRNVERFQEIGIRQLTRALTRAEWHAKRADRRKAMLAALGGERVKRLFGREEEVESVASSFDECCPRLLVTGPIGVGKTTFVRALGEAIIQRGVIQQVVWIDAPKSIDAIYLKLREQATRQGYQEIDLHDYLRRHETLLILDDVRLLAAHPEALDALLRSMPDTRIVLSHAHHLELEALTASHVLKPLAAAQTREMAEFFWNRRSQGAAGEKPDLAMMAARSAGNPLALKMMVMSFGTKTDESLARVGISTLYTRTRQLLTEEAQRLWVVLALLPAHGAPLADVRALWPAVATRAAFDALIACHVAQRAGTEGRYRLADFARQGVAHSVSDDSFTYDMLMWAIEHLDAGSDSVPSIHLIREQALIERWLPLEAERRPRWIARGWRASARGGMWSVWYSLLREATDAIPTDAHVWIGLGMCARRLALWQECEAALRRAMELAGNAGDFDAQDEAQLESSIVLRMHSRFSEALALQERVWARVSARNTELRVQAAFERAQTAVDCGDGEAALTWLGYTPESARKHLLTGEAQYLLQEFAVAEEEAGCGLALLADDAAGQGKAHDLIGRAQHAQGNIISAQNSYAQAMHLLDSVGDEYYGTRTRVNSAVLLQALGRWHNVYTLLHDREASCKRMGDQVCLAALRRLLTDARAHLARYS